jgi:hypothetical protein
MDEMNLTPVETLDSTFVEIDVLADDAAELSAEAICACGCGMGACITLCIRFAQEE